MAPSVESSTERVAFSRPAEDFDFAFAAEEAELIDLAGPCGRFVAAAKRRSKVAQPEVPKESVKEVPQAVKVSAKEVPQAVKAEKKTERISWADMMEEDDGFDWPEAPSKSDVSFSTKATEKWSWSTAATDQDFEDLLEELPEQSIVIPKSYKDLQLEKAEKLQEERRAEEERLKKEQEIARERLYLEELRKQEQLRQEKIEELLKQQQLEQLRQQQLQQEQLRQQQLQQEQLRQQQLQQEQLRQQQLQQEQLRQQQLQQQQLQQQQLQQQQLQLQQNMLQQMQQMQQLQQVPVLVAVPCMAVPMAAPEVPELKIEEKKKKNDEVVLGRGPVFGTQHRFHQKNTSMGVLSPDARSFTKCSNKGRLSIVCENRVHFSGVVRYAVQFTEGELCSADGVGFILSSDLPCTKNIQKIVSVFANRTGRICVRVHEDVKRCHQRVKCLELGDWLEVISDLEQQKVTFVVWAQDGSAPTSATISFGDVLEKARGRANVPRSACGYLAVVMKHLGVSVNLAS